MDMHGILRSTKSCSRFRFRYLSWCLDFTRFWLPNTSVSGFKPKTWGRRHSYLCFIAIKPTVGEETSLILLMERGNMQSEMQSCCRKLFCLLCQDRDGTNSWHVNPDSLLVLCKQTPTVPTLRLSQLSGSFLAFNCSTLNKETDSRRYACFFKQNENWDVCIPQQKSNMLHLNMQHQHADI